MFPTSRFSHQTEENAVGSSADPLAGIIVNEWIPLPKHVVDSYQNRHKGILIEIDSTRRKLIVSHHKIWLKTLLSKNVHILQCMLCH